jgi:trehalose-6-phosphate synthase
VQYRFCLMEAGSVKAFEKTTIPRTILLDSLDTIIEDEFSLDSLEGFGQDAEMELFEQMRQLTRRYSEAEKMVWLNETQREHRLFLVCYHLPVIVKRTEPGSAEPFEVSWNDSILARSQTSSIADSMRTYWVGTLSISLDALTVVERDFLNARLEQMDIIPIVIDDEIAAAAYFGFCKQVMWPVFHNVDQLDQIHAAWNLQDDFRQPARTSLPPNALPPSGMAGGLSASRSRANSSGALQALSGASQTQGPTGRSRSNSIASGGGSGGAENNRVLEWNNLEEEFHRAHEAVNLIFARTLLGLVRDKDVVWVHDYHLMGLPRLLRSRDERRSRRRGTSDNEKDERNASCATTSASQKITAAADAPLPVPGSLANLRIIFFMHIPFPTSQLFRTLPRAADLLESMVCADVVGFHAFDHARHFLNAAKRMLGIRSGSRPGGLITLHVADREVIVTVSHVSIETDRVGPAALHPETLRIACELRQKYAGKRIVVGVDVCQRLSGVALKLAAFDKLLSDSNWGRKGNIVLIQKCLRGNTRPGDEETTSADLRKMASDINAKYSHASLATASLSSISTAASTQPPLPAGSSLADRFAASYGANAALRSTAPTTDTASSVSTSRGSNLDSLADALPPSGRLPLAPHPGSQGSQALPQGQPQCVVDYEERGAGNELGLHERLALWLVADVFLMTPIREGLNLMPLEYVYARRDLPNAGAVVVSEFSTCAAMLNGSIKVNPFAPLRVADALEKALMLSGRDKELRRQRDLPFISSHPSYLWTQQVVNDLEQLQTPSGRGEGRGAAMPTPLQEKEVLRCYDLAAE